MRGTQAWARWGGAVLLAIALGSVGAAQRRGGSREPEAMRFRFMGPIDGNRIASAVGVPGNPDIWYMGAASGGVWKSVDGGNHFVPVFDDQPVAAIGALAISSSDPKILWAGTGEAWAIRDSDVMGDGIYKSIDAGTTWTHMGLTETGRIGRIIVHPTNPDIVYACALGRTTGPQEERGVFKTTDGGKTWQRSLFADPNTGCSGLSMDAKDPNVLVAGMWQVEMHTWAMFSGGPSSAIYRSQDGGATWTKIEGHGLPKSPVGKIDVAIAPSDSNRVYALIQTADQGSLWRSDDAGANWQVVNWQRPLIGRAGYYIRLAVNPVNPDEVFVANSSFWRSTDGGKTFLRANWGGDTHDIWWDPKNPDRFAITHDGGATLTTDHGKTTTRVSLPIGQMYHVAVDNQVPYMIYGNMQDDGTMRGLSTTPEGSGRGAGPWEHGLGGCESGFTLPLYSDPDIIWASCYGNEVSRYDARTKRARAVSPWIHTLDSPPNEAKYRCHWTPPLAIDPFDKETVYYGCQVVFRTTNGGQSWDVISPDLSTQDPSRIVSSGGIVGDNLGQFYGEVVFAIAPSKAQKGLIWAGTNDGKLWYTRDAGANWVDVTKNVGMKPWGTIRKIDPSTFDAGTAYVAVDYHLMDDRHPYIFKTSDFGQTWTNITGNLPATHPLDYVNAVAENPNRRGMLFAGTGHGFYYSLDDGGHWTQFTDGLPPAPVTWIEVQKQFHDVVVSTYGRGLYILENVTPLEQMTAETTAPVQLFKPRPTFRFTRGGRAQFDYRLSAPAAPPSRIEILDGAGTVIRTIENIPAKVGLNRASWDLRYAPPRLVALRTTPAAQPHIWDDPRFDGEETRPVTHWGLAQAEVGPVAAPGTYTVRLTIGGQTLTQPLELLRDPNFASTDADIEATVKLQLRIRDDINATSDMINQIEIWRKQLQDQQKALAGNRARAKALAAVNAIEKRMQDVELKLLERASWMSDDKYYPEKYKVYSSLIWLNGEVGTGAGDVQGGSDWKPTDTSHAVLETIEQDLAAARTDYEALASKDVPAFNRSAASLGVPPLAVGK
ncbi:MAG TPA: hypothetical protein VFK20_14485 [Vicinamibacterales bacterium]|nr:hypothetical protein [Vicinamibacterales bacterium]